MAYRAIIRGIYKRCWLPFYRWYALRYVRKARYWNYENIRLWIPVGIFHPGIYFSTPIFIDFFKNTPIKGKTVLDMGTGSGAIAIAAARMGAYTTAADIHPLAVRTAAENAALNGVAVQTMESDLFQNLEPATFDYILVNPPYYPANPANDAEKAFFAGENLEYFRRFFKESRPFMHQNSVIWMILSEDCDWRFMVQMATESGLLATVVHEQYYWGERLFVGCFKVIISG